MKYSSLFIHHLLPSETLLWLVCGKVWVWGFFKAAHVVVKGTHSWEPPQATVSLRHYSRRHFSGQIRSQEGSYMSVFPCHSPKCLSSSNTNECLLSPTTTTTRVKLTEGPTWEFSWQLHSSREEPVQRWGACAQHCWSPVLLLPLLPGSLTSSKCLLTGTLPSKHPSRCPHSSPFLLISGFCSILSQKITSKKEEYHGTSMVSEVKCPGQPLWRASQVGILCPYGLPCSVVH